MMNYTFIEQYIAATNSHHFEQLLPLVHPNAIYHFTNQTCQGITEIKAYFEHTWQLIEDEVYSVQDILCLVDTSDVKVYTYEYQYKSWHRGKITQGSGKATNVFQRNNKQWQLILEHLNSVAT